MGKKTQTTLIIALVTTAIAAIACIITLIFLSTPAYASSSTPQPPVTPNPTQPPLPTPTYTPLPSPTATYTPMPTNTPTLQPSTTEETLTWDKATTVLSGLTTILALAAVIISALQTRLLRRELNASIVLHVLERMEKLRDKRRQLYNLPPKYQNWKDKDRESADDLCVWLERIAYLADSRLVDKKYLFKNYAPVFVKCWQRLEDLVRDEREKLGQPRAIENGAFRRRHLEIFANECKEYMSRHHSNVKLQTGQNADDDDQS